MWPSRSLELELSSWSSSQIISEWFTDELNWFSLKTWKIVVWITFEVFFGNVFSLFKLKAQFDIGDASSINEALGQFMDEFELTNQVINNTAATLHYRDALKVKKHTVSAVSACFSYVPKNTFNKKQMRTWRCMVSWLLLGLYITGYRLRSFPLDIYRSFISLRGVRRKSDDMAMAFESLVPSAVIYLSLCHLNLQRKEAKNPAPLQKSRRWNINGFLLFSVLALNTQSTIHMLIIKEQTAFLRVKIWALCADLLIFFFPVFK